MMQTVDSAVRIDTGPLQIGDDWPGVFIRGDNALALANAILMCRKEGWAMPVNEGSLLDGLLKTLLTCRVK